MSHSRIIQLSPVPVTEENLLSPENLYDDYKVNAVSEYVDSLPEEDEDDELESLKESPTFADNATIKDKTVVFKDCEAIAANYDKWFDSALQKAASKAGNGRVFHGSDLRNLFSDYKDDTNLFVLSYLIPETGNLRHTTALRSAELVAELAECREMPRTWHIGAILDSKDA